MQLAVSKYLCTQINLQQRNSIDYFNLPTRCQNLLIVINVLCIHPKGRIHSSDSYSGTVLGEAAVPMNPELHHYIIVTFLEAY